MIIQGKKLRFPLVWRKRLIGFFFFILVVIGFNYFIGFASSFLPTESGKWYCDAEQSIGGNFISGGHYFHHGSQQSAEKAHSGKYACKIDPGEKYGFGIEIENVLPGDRFSISVWRAKGSDSGGIITASTDAKELFAYHDLVVQKENEWEKISVYLICPELSDGLLNIYTVSEEKGSVFFDDLSIKKLARDSSFQNLPVLSPLRIFIPEEGLAKLNKKRDQAFRDGVLVSQDDDWIKGEIIDKDEKKKVKLRLKGDWLDHLRGDKWSYRISVAAPYAWNRLKTFSVQSPHTRSFLNEWVYHQMLTQEDVLCTRYDFLEVGINRKNTKIYAVEEHFEKQLVEYRSRREGPILRFSEDGFWQKQQKQIKQYGKVKDFKFSYSAFNSSKISAFQSNKTIKNPVLLEQFKNGANLMDQYRLNRVEAKEIFDLELVAKYFAIMDVNHAWHALAWHNQRWYFNPITQHLEPIGFDGWSEGEFGLIEYAPFIGFAVYKYPNPNQEIFHHLFNDPSFLPLYLKYLNKYSQEDYLQGFWSKYQIPLTEREALIQKEYTQYQYDQGMVVEFADAIQRYLIPISEESLKANLHQEKNDEVILSIVNHHCVPLEIIGFGMTKNKVDFASNYEETVPTYFTNEPQKPIQLTTNKQAKFVFFKLPGVDDIYYSQITPWPIEDLNQPAQDFFKGKALDPDGPYKIDGNTVTFEAGEYVISKNLIIPEGYVVKFLPGAIFDFVNKAAFISKSPVFIQGNSEQPVVFSSSDQTASGFTVLQCQEASFIQHAVFDNFNTFRQEGWTLTGAVTFYESEVDITYAVFRNNHCEDALNIVRSKFSLKHSRIANTFADGFDCDFCNGMIGHTVFSNTGNDGMDFSGSVIHVTSASVINPGDKGISIGEQATVTGGKVDIEGAKIGIAVKDLSKLTINQVDLLNCEIGFSAYQKKPEYGGSTIQVNNYSAEKVERLHSIENGSVLTLNGNKIDGQ